MAIVNNKRIELEKTEKELKIEKTIKSREKHKLLVEVGVKALKNGWFVKTIDYDAEKEVMAELINEYNGDKDKIELEWNKLKEMCTKYVKIGGCNPKTVYKEPQNVTCILPDVIAWKDNNSYVIECKTSKRDFKNDDKKRGKVGDYFYYLTYPDIIKVEDLKNEEDGLMYYYENSKKVLCIKQAKKRQNDHKGTEIAILLSIIRGTNINAKTDDIK